MQEPLRMTISFHKNKTDRFALDKKHLIYQKGGSFLVIIVHLGASKNASVFLLFVLAQVILCSGNKKLVAEGHNSLTKQ